MKSICYLYFITNLIFIVTSDKQEWTDPLTKTYYNFNALVRESNKPWVAKKQGGNYIDYYTFNFGQNIPTPCKGTSASVIQTMEIAGGAVPYCNIIGSHDQQEIKLINQANPNEGIIVTYNHVEPCHDNSTNLWTHKKANFYLFCSDKQDEEVIRI
jgi:hypothetical protein